MGLKRRLEKLERQSGRSSVALQDAWGARAAERLTDQEFRLISDALHRERDLEGEDFPQLELSPEEQQALDTYYRYFEEAIRAASG